MRLADPSDVMALHEVRRAAIRQLSLTHLSLWEAADWAERGGIPRVKQAIARDEVWVATRGALVVAWLHRAGNSIEGLYVSPPVARQGVGAALVRLAESHIAQGGHPLVVLRSSLNALGFYLRLGYAPFGTECSLGAIAMRKHLDAVPKPSLNAGVNHAQLRPRSAPPAGLFRQALPAGALCAHARKGVGSCR
jgi:GNAT superfamily N-acetyltransferase